MHCWPVGPEYIFYKTRNKCEIWNGVTVKKTSSPHVIYDDEKYYEKDLDGRLALYNQKATSIVLFSSNIESLFAKDKWATVTRHKINYLSSLVSLDSGDLLFLYERQIEKLHDGTITRIGTLKKVFLF